MRSRFTPQERCPPKGSATILAYTGGMHTAQVQKLERAVDSAASALFAGASAFAAYRWLALDLTQPMLGAGAGAAGLLAYVCCRRALGAVVAGASAHRVPVFDVRELEPFDPESFDDAPEPLLLDDVLAEPQPDSRVVRLFDAAAMATPAELKSRIDRHLEGGATAAQSAEATQALHDALAELRRSLR